MPARAVPERAALHHQRPPLLRSAAAQPDLLRRLQRRQGQCDRDVQQTGLADQEEQGEKPVKAGVIRQDHARHAGSLPRREERDLELEALQGHFPPLAARVPPRHEGIDERETEAHLPPRRQDQHHHWALRLQGRSHRPGVLEPPLRGRSRCGQEERDDHAKAMDAGRAQRFLPEFSLEPSSEMQLRRLRWCHKRQLQQLHRR